MRGTVGCPGIIRRLNRVVREQSPGCVAFGWWLIVACVLKVSCDELVTARIAINELPTLLLLCHSCTINMFGDTSRTIGLRRCLISGCGRATAALVWQGTTIRVVGSWLRQHRKCVVVPGGRRTDSSGETSVRQLHLLPKIIRSSNVYDDLVKMLLLFTDVSVIRTALLVVTLVAIVHGGETIIVIFTSRWVGFVADRESHAIPINEHVAAVPLQLEAHARPATRQGPSAAVHLGSDGQQSSWWL